MTSFVSAFQKACNIIDIIENENGAILNKSTTNPCVDAFNKLVRGITMNNLTHHVNEIINFAKNNNDSSIIEDLFVTIFHKRNCRGGEGEKLITYQLILAVYEHYPMVVNKVITLLPLYGYYKDYFEIWAMICNMESLDKYRSLINTIVESIIIQLKKDLSSENDISLLAKWLPRQGNMYNTQCYWYDIKSEKRIKSPLYLASIFFNQPPFNPKTSLVNNWILMKYRKMVSELTKKLNVPEIYMCAKNYHMIEFEKVASKALKTYSKAFLNEKAKGSLGYNMQETGNRYPDDIDRVSTRKKLLQFIQDGNISKLKGAQLDPHEIMSKLARSSSSVESEILRAQWVRKKEDVINQTKKLMETSSNLKGIGRCIPMIDVSGSMCGKNDSGVEPIEVAIALGIMTSELSTPPFNNMAISFTESPILFNFYEEQTPDEKRNVILNNYVGYSTKFGKAIELILKICVDNKVPSSDIPNLIVFTDGQFDQMNTPQQTYANRGPSKVKPWKTSHEELLTMWANAGYDKIPNIIYWNLRANTPGFQTSSDHPGVQMLQGYSPSLMKFILYGETFNETKVNVETENGMMEMKTSSVTPYDTFRKAVDQDVYLPIREIISSEKLF
jgi:hypothetical protein